MQYQYITLWNNGTSGVNLGIFGNACDGNDQNIPINLKYQAVLGYAALFQTEKSKGCEISSPNYSLQQVLECNQN